ncbi:B3/B4 domain-containing protein [Sinosporangium siamense]|uniref:B3/B4 tRNA-binding domain-containing protein n=1 Tax=Sinosporangium siamense TaxID=1367973 RepID=A0A919RLF0_9ACTN|nr:phenylalanine--tRNA ligase beta subunit-related protein [Sinosporangium siamense]GII95965.1 hypothetical protein Ssi02_61960 [Sinosporangium siamense]
MYLQHSSAIWSEFPELVAGAVVAVGVSGRADVDERIARFTAVAEARLATSSEAEFPEIQAWRRTFSKMGLKPTQYRCASEALLRRFKKERVLPRIHPLIDLCNAISVAFAVPVAAIDLERVEGGLDVRHAKGDEHYLTFGGDTEHPAPDEVVFADAAGRAHARRWTNRQSGYSAVRESTRAVVIVAEAMHESARDDVPALIAAIAEEVGAAWQTTPRSAILTAASPRFEFDR